MTQRGREREEKPLEEYRRDIFALKNKLKTEEEQLLHLRQKYADADILADKSYSFSMKLKILQYTLNDIRSKLQKFSGEQEYEYYCLNFAALGLVKSCQVMGMSPEMVFRGVDVEGKGAVGWFELSNFLREVMRLDSEYINPIMKALCPDESKPITMRRYQTFLASFLLSSEQNGEEVDNLDGAIDRISSELTKQKIEPSSLWKQKEVNVAQVADGLMRGVKFLDVLDCIGCYCKCDPLKAGVVNTSAVVALLQHRVSDRANFTKIRLKK